MLPKTSYKYATKYRFRPREGYELLLISMNTLINPTRFRPREGYELLQVNVEFGQIKKRFRPREGYELLQRNCIIDVF